jgi:hypothetical protein
MYSPGDAISTIGQYLWIIPVAIWVFLLIGVSGSIISFFKWVNSGVKTVFSPWGLITFVVLAVVSGVALFLFDQWWKGLGW